MRKIFGVLLSVLCICCAAIGLTGCKKDKHIHAFDKQVITDEYKATDVTCTEAATYYYSCSCGEKGTETFGYGSPLGHSFTNYVSDNNATCTHDGTKTAKCDRCNEKNTVIAIGTKLGHSFTNYVSDNNATCTQDGTKTAKCDRCNETDTIPDENSKLGHEFTDYVSDNNATYKKDGTKTAHCNRNGCTATDTIPDENSKLESKITFKTLTVGEKNTDGNVSVYGKVPNAQKTYSFIDEIETEGVARFVVSMDVYGMHTVVTKTIPLSEGDNKIFVIELNGEDVKSIYEVTIRRRPMYSVVFDTNGGTILDSRQIEEGTVITAPETTKAGYTFIEWDYDFTQPITQNTTIKATWSANTNTTYKVEYYLENIDDADYSLYETSNLQGTTDTTATAEIKTYDHFTFYKNNSILSGNVSGDGSLVLKVYYTRSTYTLSNANTSYGEITNAATKKYGSEIDSVATEYLGCGFLGWYNGEELLSTAREYTFTIETNVTAKFKIKDEMSNFNFNSSVDTCNITGLKDKTVSKIIVPDYVTSIGGSAFSDCSVLTSVIWNAENCTSAGSSLYSIFSKCSKLINVTIGVNVKTIPSYAFMDCSGLTSVTIGNRVTSIGCYAFYNCSGLTSVTIPNSVTSIGDSAFSGCGGLTSVTIPDSVTSIGDSAFGGCSGLTSVTIGNSVTSIGGYAFYNCSGLTSVTIPNSVTSIGDSVFSGCSGLTSVTIPDSVTSIRDGAFSDCDNLKYNEYSNALYLGNKNNPYVALIKAKSTDITSCIISEKCKVIGDEAFENCSGLTSVTIPDSVTSIGSGVFSYCSGIESLVVTTGNKKYHSANNCIIETETKELIAGCKTSIIPSDGSVTSIGDSAFRGCSGLTSVTIPDSVTSIGSSAFSGCYKLVEVINKSGLNITKGSSDNGYIAYYALNVKSGGTSNIANKDGYLFYTCDNVNYLVTYVGSNTDLTLPDDYNEQDYELNNYAFYNCGGLTSVTIPDSVTSIGNYAFRYCRSLTSVTIPNSVTSIGNYAFSYCRSLTSVTIPNSVTSIGNYAFYNCSGLTNVIWNVENCTRAGSIFSKCSKLINVTIGANVKTIPSYAFMDCSGLTSITIPDSVTSIGDYAFYGCSGLTSVTIPNSVTSIGSSAFSGCSEIKSLVVTAGNKKYYSANNCIIEPETKELIAGCKTSIIPSDGSVTFIGDYAFYGCSGLTSVTIPDSVTSIGNYAFYGCSGLTSVTIPNSVTSIGDRAFLGCGGLTSVTIGNGVTSIGDYAFSGCSGLTSVTIPDSVTSIGKWAFYGCRGLTNVIWNAENCTSAGSFSYHIFSNCSKLTNVTIGANVKIIPSYAFRGCSGLKNITYIGTIADWQNIVTGNGWNYEVSKDCIIHCTDGNIKLFK